MQHKIWWPLILQDRDYKLAETSSIPLKFLSASQSYLLWIHR
jgi:hypothetical protein